VFLHGLKSPLSSTALRAQRGRSHGHEGADGQGVSADSHKSAAESGENDTVVAPTAVADAGGDERRRARGLAPGT